MRASRIAANRMTLGAFISFGVGLVLMYQPFKRATRINLALQTALASARRLFEVLDAPNDIVGRARSDGRSRRSRARSVSTGVSFAYPGDAPVLHGIDLAVPSGSVTALVGPSGAGKTTLANLVPRFMDVDAGSVSVDGVDVRRRRRSPRCAGADRPRDAGRHPLRRHGPPKRRVRTDRRPRGADPRRPRGGERARVRRRAAEAASTRGWGSPGCASRAASGSASRSRGRS